MKNVFFINIAKKSATVNENPCVKMQKRKTSESTLRFVWKSVARLFLFKNNVFDAKISRKLRTPGFSAIFDFAVWCVCFLTFSFIFFGRMVVYLTSGSRLTSWWTYPFSYCFHRKYRCAPKIRFSADISIDMFIQMCIDMLTDIFIDISVDMFIGISIDIFIYMFICIFTGILTCKEEGGGRSGLLLKI